MEKFMSGMQVDEDFKTSSLSRWPTNVGNRCVAVKRNQDGVLVRDTKVQDGPILEFTHEEWEAFIGGVRLGEFDLGS